MDINQLITALNDYIDSLLPSAAPFAAVVGVLLVAAWVSGLLARVVAWVLSWVIGRNNAEIVAILLRAGLLWVVADASIEWSGLDVSTAMVVMVGVLVAALTLNSEQLASNAVAGVIIRAGGFFSVGNFVDVAGADGRIERIGWLHCHISDPVTRDITIVANSDILSGNIVNRSAIRGHPVEVTIPVFDYGQANRTLAQSIMLKVANDFDANKGGEAFDPTVHFARVGGNAEYWLVRIYAQDGKIHGPIISELSLLLIAALENNSIGVGEVGEVGFATTELRVVSRIRNAEAAQEEEATTWG